MSVSNLKGKKAKKNKPKTPKTHHYSVLSVSGTMDRPQAFSSQAKKALNDCLFLRQQFRRETHPVT